MLSDPLKKDTSGRIDENQPNRQMESVLGDSVFLPATKWKHQNWVHISLEYFKTNLPCLHPDFILCTVNL